MFNYISLLYVLAGELILGVVCTVCREFLGNLRLRGLRGDLREDAAQGLCQGELLPTCQVAAKDGAEGGNQNQNCVRYLGRKLNTCTGEEETNNGAETTCNGGAYARAGGYRANLTFVIHEKYPKR
nr:MAG TPA: hypothetical protein [Caudoviricetes sp.]